MPKIPSDGPTGMWNLLIMHFISYITTPGGTFISLINFPHIWLLTLTAPDTGPRLLVLG